MLQPIILCFTAISLMGCIVSDDTKVHHINGPTMGTWYNVKLQGVSDHSQVQTLQSDINLVLEEVNQQMSTYLPDSELSLFNQSPTGELFNLSRDTLRVLKISQQIYRESNGAFDITVGPLVDLWGFGPSPSNDEPPQPRQVQETLFMVGADAIKLGKGSASKAKAISIDLSAVAKGYAADKVAQVLESAGIYHYMVEIGGEIKVGKRKKSGAPWRIAIEEPTGNERSIQKVLALESIAVATSGDYRNYYEKDGKRYSHTIDPRTGVPIDHNLASVTVLHPSCAYADAYATAISVLGPEKGLALAKSLNLTVYMLVKEKEGFSVLQTKSFSNYVDTTSI